MSSQDQEAFHEEYNRLWNAAYNLYMEGHWVLKDHTACHKQQVEMWEALRESLGLQPGHFTNIKGK